MDKILAFSLLYAAAILIFIWYIAISPAIASYVSGKVLDTQKKIITVFCIVILPLILSAFTEKVFASYTISIMLLLLYIELKKIIALNVN